MTTDDTHSLGACIKHWRLQKGLPLEVIALKTRIPAKYLRALESNDFSALPPIEPVHHTLGESLREYRTRQGLSIESIADRTRVPLASLQALEENNSKNLPEAPVIIRSFVDAYLNCLTLQETEKEIVLIQLAKMIYATSRHEPTDPAPTADREGQRALTKPFNVWSHGLHDRALGIYIRLTDWRTTFCRDTVSAYQRSLAQADHLCHRLSSLSAQAGRTVYQKTTVGAVELVERTRPEGGWSTLWTRMFSALTTGAEQIRRAIVSVHSNLAPLVRRAFVRHNVIQNGPSSDHVSPVAPQKHAQPLEGKPWMWLVQYGSTVLLLLMLGSTASTIPLFKHTAFAETKLTASNLVAFIGYGGALLMVWLMGRKAVGHLIRDGKGLAFLRPLGAPFNTLLGVSASYELLFTLVGPSLGKADRLTYNWIFVILILAATLWLIRTWFLKSAPLLESLDTTDQANRSRSVAIASFRD